MRFTFLTFILCAGLVTGSAFSLSSPASAQGLKSPFKTLLPPDANPKGEIFECAKTPPAIASLNIVSLYKETDPTESVPDPKSEEIYYAQVKPLYAYLDEVARMSNIYTRSNGRNLSSAKCALTWLNDWGQKEAFLSDPSSYGKFVRAWSLAAVSSSYIQIALDGRLDSAQKVAVKKWLSQLNKAVMRDYSSRYSDKSIPKNNNLYWAAWAVGITSTVLQNPENFRWAIEKAKTGLIQIEDDGTMPLEVRRASRAQLYHLFAAVPLVMLAELGANNGVNLYAYNNGALHRLVKLNVTQFENPEYLTHRSGARQSLDRKLIPAFICWLEPYMTRFGFSDPKTTRIAERMLMTYRPLFERRAGGDTTLLFGTQQATK